MRQAQAIEVEGQRESALAHSEEAEMRSLSSPASRLNAILHEQPADYDACSGTVNERVV